MRKQRWGRVQLGAWAALLSLVILLAGPRPVQAMRRHKRKEKRGAVSPNDPTARLFQLLNVSFGGKLSGLYVLADVYSDPSNGQQYQRVLKVDYNKSIYFGRLAIHVRSVGKMTPEQLTIYTPEQIFNFGDSDGEVFDRTDPGPFGSETGDLYLSAADGGPPHVAQISDAVTAQYRLLVTQYILPALEKQLAQNAKSAPVSH